MTSSFTIPSYISRPQYVERVRPYIGKQIIKVLTGQRRVGKSYLLYELMEVIRQEYGVDDRILYINKEDLQFSHLQNAHDLHTYITEHLQVEGRTFVFIDEIQDISEFHIALRSLLLLPGLDLYITGSNANLLSSDLAGFLSGRFIEVNIYSLNYNEFLTFHSLADEDSALQMYLKYGGLPYLKHLPLQENIIFEYLSNIYNSIVYRDVVNRFGVRNTAFLERLVQFLAEHIGSLFSSRKISEFLKAQKVNINPVQVQNYLHHLCSAFIVLRVPRYDIQGKRIFEFGEKYFFENLGIRNAICGYKPQDLGKIIENAVFNHLLSSGYSVNTGALGQEEIDFVAQKANEKCYIQVALRLTEEKTFQREFGNLSRIADHYPKMVITLDEFDGNSIDGIKQLSLRKFLTRDDFLSEA